MRPCPKCRGRGHDPRWLTGGGRCFRCSGSGRLMRRPRCKRTYRIRIKLIVPQWVVAALLSSAYAIVAARQHQPVIAASALAATAVLLATGLLSAQRKRIRLPHVLREAVFVRDGFCCVGCGSADHLAVDHIRPLARGGSDRISNLQTLCRSCNSKKGTK